MRRGRLAAEEESGSRAQMGRVAVEEECDKREEVDTYFGADGDVGDWNIVQNNG